MAEYRFNGLATEQLLFSVGKSPMIAIGTWQPENIVMNNPDLLDKVEVVWFPYFDDHPELANGNMGGPNEGLSITKRIRHYCGYRCVA